MMGILLESRTSWLKDEQLFLIEGYSMNDCFA